MMASTTSRGGVSRPGTAMRVAIVGITMSEPNALPDKGSRADDMGHEERGSVATESDSGAGPAPQSVAAAGPGREPAERRPRVMFVDDEENVLAGLRRLLHTAK